MRPQSIIRFDQFYLGSLAVGLANSAFSYDTMIAQLQAKPETAKFAEAFGPTFFVIIIAFSMGISLLLWWLTSRKANDVARWILTVLTGIGILGLPFSIAQLPVLQLLITLVITGMQIAAIWFLFRPDAKGWFAHGPKGMDPEVFE